MGNEQSVEGQAIPDTGLKLSTLCRYQAEPGNEDGMGFLWFQASTDVSGLVLRGAHRFGYVLSHIGGQRLFKDMRQRFFILLDHYVCYFDSHAPEARMKGSIDLDKAHCHIELLPRTAESVETMLHSGGGGGSGGGEGDEHRLEITRRTDEFSMVLCFSSANSLSDWMKSIFDVQQRHATFSPLRHAAVVVVGGGGNAGDETSSDSDDSSGLPRSLPLGHYGNSSSSRSNGGIGGSGVGNTSRQSRRRGFRRRGRRRGTLPSPPPRAPRRGVPSSWTDDVISTMTQEGEGTTGGRRVRLVPSETRTSTSSVRLGKASERLAGLPRGGRAAGNDSGGGSDGLSNLDEYGAFTTAQASIYEGWTRGLQPHGWGRMVFANGDCVEGWWEHDVLQGSGCEYTSRQEGWTYCGGYVNGERHGPGRLVYSSTGDVWECEWEEGVVVRGSRGMHTTGGGELYQGGCGPSAVDPAVPVRAGQGRLRRCDGEQVESRFREGKAVDGAKGVVRFRNGAIFFGELQEARPHGYGELYLSSVKSAGDSRSRSSSNSRRRRKSSSSLAELDEMARDVLWYKGDFYLGKPHGSGLIKYKEPAVLRPEAAMAKLGAAVVAAETGAAEGKDPPFEDWGECKDGREGDEWEKEREVDVGGGSEDEVAAPLARARGATDEDLLEEDEGTSDSEEDDDDQEEEDDGGRRRNRSNNSCRRASLPEGRKDNTTTESDVSVRRGQRPPAEGGSGSGSSSSSGSGGGVGDDGGADMEYEADFVHGVMVRHDASHLRLAALRFGRAEIRRLETLLKKEEEAMSRLRVKGLCLLCNAQEMNALLVGCRHRVLCVGCAGRADKCPVCSEPIGKVVKTYST